MPHTKTRQVLITIINDISIEIRDRISVHSVLI